MTVKELKNRLSAIDGNATVQFGDYVEHDIGDIVITIGEDGATTVLLKEAKKKTDAADES